MGPFARPALACLLAAGAASAFVVRAPASTFITPTPRFSSSLSARRTTPTAVLTTALGWRFGKRGLLASPQVQKQETSTALASAAAASGGEKKKMTAFEMYEKGSELLVNLFPLWTIIFSGLALKRPELFSWLTTNYFTAGLGLLMLSMGITLSPKDFTDVLKVSQDARYYPRVLIHHGYS